MSTSRKTRRADGNQQRPPMKNPSRERMKAEIALLRDQLSMLEAKRHDLMQQNPMDKSSESVHPVYLEIAGEYEKRKLAEQENKRLRRAVAKQLQSVKAMINSLQIEASWLDLPQQPSLSRVLNDDYGYRFSFLHSDANRTYKQVDRMIQFETDNHEQPRKFASTLTSRTVDNQELLTLEGRETSVIPYDLKNYHEAMWQAVQESAWSEYRMASVHVASADCVIVRLFSDHRVGGETVELTTTLVIKSFMEADRCVIVWRAVSSLDGHTLDSDVYIDESGWSVAEMNETMENLLIADCMSDGGRDAVLPLDSRVGREVRMGGSGVGRSSQPRASCTRPSLLKPNRLFTKSWHSDASRTIPRRQYSPQ